MRALALCAALCLGVIWGMAAVRFGLFPYPQARVVLAPLIPDAPAPVDRTAEARQSVFDALPPGRPEVIFLGDSLTAEGLWAEFFPQTTIANRGIRGDTTLDILSRLDLLTATDPARIYLMIGINYLAEGRAIATIAETTGAIVQALQGAGHKVVLQSVLPCDPARCGVAPADITQLNTYLAEIAQEEGARWLDLTPAFAAQDLTHDGLHLTGAGYRAWVAAITAAGGP